ncbi:MAG: Gfo/Idh/MocA family oxidoreductase [Limnochordia bacterium]|jgi:predicted dehydrogenase|nr:Gfo/Idh/MocA family oxidoreductase [Limnochordia bacterium]
MGTLNIGLVGYKFMGKAHSHAFRDVSMFFDLPVKPVMKVLCGRDEKSVAESARKFGWEEYVTSWEELVQRDDIDLIDITAPSNVHKEIVLAAAQNGKHIFCEKPLALTLEDAEQMLKAVTEAGVKHMIGFNYRRVPAIMLIKQMVDSGKLGQIYHFRGTYLQDYVIDPSFPLVWRLRKEIAGSGSLGDLGAHTIDLARWLVGDFHEVIGMSETFIKERPLPTEMTGLSAKSSLDAEMGTVTVDDATAFLARFKNGALGTFEATRFAAGHRNMNFFEINGSLGSVRFDFERMNEMEYYSTEDAEGYQGFRRIQTTEAVHPYMQAWWPAGHIIGYEHTFIHEMKDFIESIVEDRLPEPNFRDGVECQRVLHAVEKSIDNRTWVQID